MQALHLVDVMEDEGVVPDVATWGTLMSAAKYLGQTEAAEMVRLTPAILIKAASSVLHMFDAPAE